MIDAEVTAEQVLALPLRDAIQLLATIVWLGKAADNPTMTIQDALSVPLSEALEAIQAAEAAGTVGG